MRQILAILLLLVTSMTYSQKVIVLTDYVSQESITDYQMKFLHDPQCNIHPPELFTPAFRRDFQQLDFKNPSLRLETIEPGDCIWFRFIFLNRSSHQISFHLQPNIFSSFGEYKLYQKFPNGVITERLSGKNIQPRAKDVNISGSDELRFYMNPGTRDTLFLRVAMIESSVLTDLTFTVSTHDSVIRKDRSRRLLFGIFLGILVIMILYHIPLYLKVRESSYLYYIFYIIAFLGFFILKEGYIYELTPQFTDAPINTLLLQVFLLSFLLFGRSYLDTSKNLKIWDRILLIAIGFTVGGLAMSIIMIIFKIPSVVTLSVNFLAAIASLFLAIVPAFILKKKHFQPARYFLTANIFLILGVILLFSLKNFTIGKHGLEIGVTLQIITFSVGMGEKINLLKRDRERAQRRIIDQLRENAILKDKVNRELEDKVKERTLEIQLQKEQIEKQNKEIKYSFDYAKKIQSTVLPPNEVFENLFAEHFIFFRPRDIVSGDFYWIAQKENKIVIAAVDCTGHGVPGSLMSMLGITLLHEIVNEKDVIQADEILNQLRSSIARTLKQEGKPGEQKDGMDMVVLIYDPSTRDLEFSGANNPMYIIHKGKMNEYKGNNMPVAYYDNMTDFTRETITLKQGDRIYLFSDGFPDQFGGPQGKKFKYRPFKDLLLEMHDRPMEEQEKILRMVFDEWKGDMDQIDDVLVMGLRF